MAPRRKLIDDEGWHEVVVINNYAMFMGYISMAIKGLGFLVLTWTTVVLLGGFVSMLQKKDFWCLTFITLVQTAGIFDVVLNEKLSQVWESSLGLGFSIWVFMKGDKGRGTRRAIVATVFAMVQVLVLLILLCPLAAIYVFGLLISTGISLWRLIQHDYGRNSTKEPNLKPALDTLYCLALLQGVLFCYRFLLALTQKRLAKEVAAKCDDEEELEIVSNYMGETRIGCEKDPSFARGRNLITCCVDLIASKSPDDCLSGVQMLYTAIHIGERGLKDARRAHGLGRKEAGTRFKGKTKEVGDQWEEIIGQHLLMKHLIVSPSSSPVLGKLLEMLDPRGAYDREMRNQAARIVAHLALDIHLEQFPRAIQYISTLTGMTFEEYHLIEPYNRDRLLHKYDQGWARQASLYLALPGNELREAYEKLVLRGLCILWKLATDEDNCRIMSQTRGLLPTIMAPLTSDIIHQFNNSAWSISVVEGSLKVMRLLAASPGETGAKLRREIFSNKEAIGTMERILSCDSCGTKLKKRAMGILTLLYMDNQLENRATAFIKMLVDIFFAWDSKDRSIRMLAGEALAKLCSQGRGNAGIILQVKGDVVGSLTKILLLEDAENKTCRIKAAEILEHMCVHHTQDDEFLGKLKEAMTDTMPKVLAQILTRGLTKDETHPRTEEAQVEVIKLEVDIENQCDENGMDKTSSSSHPQNNEDYEDEVEAEEDESEKDEHEDFHAPLLSLCVTICNTFIHADQDLACQFGAISLPKKLKEMVAENSVPTVPCLRLMKLTCKMVISMMKHRGSYLKEDLDSLTEALSIASKRMSLLDISMVFASEDDGAATTMKPVSSLASLVKEAKESVATYFKAQESENVQSVTSADG